MILVDTALRAREAEGNPIRVGLVGAGFMGQGLTNQVVNSVPGMRMVAVSNRNPDRARQVFEYAGTEPPKNAKIMLEASERTYLLPKTPWAAEAETASAPLLRELWDGKKNANTVADDVKRLLDPILQKEFSFRTD